MPRIWPFPLAALAGILGWLQPMPTIPDGHDGLCAQRRVGGIDYIVCSIDLERHDLALMAEDASGTPYRTFGGARRALEAEGREMLLAMNAGMYHEDRRAVGLAVQAGRELHPAATGEGPGNFSMKPNGVFFVEDGRAAVMETGRYLSRPRRPDLATQSGPMLLIDGALHPRFIEGSDSLYVRNGACALEDGRAVRLVMTRQPVNFWDFAKFFRDELGCRDALFFDGQVSSLYYPAAGIDQARDALGPMLAVTTRRVAP
ncbi:phosphodiester glycosidase family protein [Aurantimonas sp. Leaf443]|uniref:phosphodiester glycosidase family protein n=1 Tax=Aurantimonas sp. Leaf443 TaxID=1736378 RepID=UPI0012E3386A|nr:phosphodiester glycosidase family protein [Aurantimonas sp. Leaf443]